jgi:hypothetical protein
VERGAGQLDEGLERQGVQAHERASDAQVQRQLRVGEAAAELGVVDIVVLEGRGADQLRAGESRSGLTLRARTHRRNVPMDAARPGSSSSQCSRCAGLATVSATPTESSQFSRAMAARTSARSAAAAFSE